METDFVWSLVFSQKKINLPWRPAPLLIPPTINTSPLRPLYQPPCANGVIARKMSAHLDQSSLEQLLAPLFALASEPIEDTATILALPKGDPQQVLDKYTPVSFS